MQCCQIVQFGRLSPLDCWKYCIIQPFQASDVAGNELHRLPVVNKDKLMAVNPVAPCWQMTWEPNEAVWKMLPGDQRN